jgi:hypothetical protein
LKAIDETGVQQAPAAGLESEWKLLLAACSTLPQSEKTARIASSVQSAIRWNPLFHLAQQHGLTCLMYQSLSAFRDIAPAAEMRKLDRCYESNLHKVLLTAREFIRILDCLDSLGVEVMPYKGLALAETLYGDIAARQSGDIDLLIHAWDLARIKNAVHDLGYTTHLALSEKEERAYLASAYECAFDGAAGKNLLEVQWALQPRFYAVDFDMERLFLRAKPVTVAGRNVRTLSFEDQVLVLSAHAAKHMWKRLVWLSDIARLMDLPAIDWIWIESEARDLGILRILRVTLLLAQHLLQAAMPAAISESTIGDTEAHTWSQSIASQITSGAPVDVESMPYFQTMLRLRERPRDRMRFLWRLALTPGPSEWKSVHLPAPLFPLYRFVRLSRLAAKVAKA